VRAFISYQSEDEPFARDIGHHLDERGHTVAFYPLRLTDPVNEIAKELRHADLLLLTLGRNTSKSTWVAAEILAAQVRNLPMVAILLDEESASPLTLPLNTPVVAYPSLVNTRFALFDTFPSRQLRSRRWAQLRIKVSPYRHPDKDKIPPPLIDRKSITNILLFVVGVICMAVSYILGFILPWLVQFAVQLLKGRELDGALNLSTRVLGIPILTVWMIVFTLILFYKPRKRLAYPLWILWFFKDYIPAWLSIRAITARSEMKKVMQRLSKSPGNRAYWKEEQARRTDGLSKDLGRQRTKDLFSLLSRDERRSGPYGEFDEKGLSEIYALIHSIPDFDIGRYGRSVVMVERSPVEVEVFSPQCPAPFCLCGKVVRLRKVDDKWQIVSKNW
jgi:hypothetical protein